MSKELPNDLPIGIDLGTTNCCVAFYRDATAEAIPNEDGIRTTPSYVSFEDGERIVGKDAKSASFRNPTNTIFGVKRLIGHRYHDSVIQAAVRNCPFAIVEADGLPRIEVDERNVRTQYKPEEISAIILERLNQIAEDYLGKPSNGNRKAVITVPASFNDAQRRASKEAGEQAGLEVIGIVNEPTAAAVAYGLHKKGTQRILVFDFGGGTLDVSVLEIVEGSQFNVLSTCGYFNLGGEDVDEILLAYFVKEFETANNVSLLENPKAFARLRLKAEEIKKSFSQRKTANLAIDALHQGHDFSCTLTRDKFDELCSDLMSRTLGPVREALLRAGLEKTDIDQIVMVGGSSRLPGVRELLSGFFDGKPLHRDINADEAIACGAAIMARELATSPAGNAPSEISITDVIPFSLGVELVAGRMAKIIPRSTKVPCEITKTFTTPYDNQSHVDIKVYEGEDDLVANNNLVNEFRFSGFDCGKGKAGEPEIDVTFKYDKSGLLHVLAVDKKSNVAVNVMVNRNQPRQNAENGTQKWVAVAEEIMFEF